MASEISLIIIIVKIFFLDRCTPSCVLDLLLALCLDITSGEAQRTLRNTKDLAKLAMHMTSFLPIVLNF